MMQITANHRLQRLPLSLNTGAQMIPRPIKLPWFFIACWISLLMPALMFDKFLSRSPLLGAEFNTLFIAVASFVWISLAAMLIDLWTSKEEKPEKIKWTILLVFLYLVVAPFYWTRQVLKRKGPLALVLTGVAFAGIVILTAAYLVYLYVG